MIISMLPCQRNMFLDQLRVKYSREAACSQRRNILNSLIVCCLLLTDNKHDEFSRHALIVQNLEATTKF